jgi:hypothetical protein
MDKILIARHLSQAENHLRTAALHVENQRQLIADLERDGHSTLKAEALLDKFENSLSLHATNRDRIARELHESTAEETH